MYILSTCRTVFSQQPLPRPSIQIGQHKIWSRPVYFTAIDMLICLKSTIHWAWQNAVLSISEIILDHWITNKTFLEHILGIIWNDYLDLVQRPNIFTWKKVHSRFLSHKHFPVKFWSNISDRSLLVTPFACQISSREIH